MLMEGQRFNNIDIAAGIAIILVVFGHMHFPELMKVKWYMDVREFVYKVHMPLFIFLSGFVAFLSASKVNFEDSGNYWSFIGKKGRKFIPAYLFFGILAIALDIIIYHKSFHDITPALAALLLYPIKGSAGFIWYLYVLLGFYLITPLLTKLKQKTLIALFIVSFLLTFVPLPPHFSANLFGRYLFFFVGGALLYKYYESLKFLIQHYGWIFLYLFVLAGIVDFTVKPLPVQLLSILFIMGILYLTLLNWGNMASKLISYIGRGSFAIYLLDSLVLNILYIVVARTVSPFPAIPFVISGVVFGLSIPLGIRNLFNKIVPRSVYMI
jgi:peptidoglycan/LPS O-acetylase OafA/YrhL